MSGRQRESAALGRKTGLHGRTHPRRCKREARKLRKHARDYGHPDHYCRKGGRKEKERERQRHRDREAHRELHRHTYGFTQLLEALH